jgi:hypothetical protein
MARLRVLITNLSLWYRSGTELYTRDLALGLARRGHSPVVFSTQLGAVADEIQRATVPVVNDLAAIAALPDIIHGHHSLETMAALLRFPTTPAIFVCHDAKAWHDTPPSLPAIRRYVAVDRACSDRLLLRHGIPEQLIRLLPNAVDVERFQPRGPLPDRPQRALLYNNYAGPRELAELYDACRARGIQLDAIGHGLGGKTASPEQVLPQYDLVFAKGRSALEAAAVGAAVVVFDPRGCGPMLTTGGLDEFACGGRCPCEPVRCDALISSIDQYDPLDAAAVMQRIRAEHDLRTLLDRMEDLYQEVLSEPPATISPQTWLQSASAEFTWWAANWNRLLREATEPPAVPSPVQPPKRTTLGRVRRSMKNHVGWLKRTVQAMF